MDGGKSRTEAINLARKDKGLMVRDMTRIGAIAK